MCCEIMEDDGTMMQTDRLWELANAHNMKFITIKDLQDYCRLHEKHVVQEAKVMMPTKYGEFTMYGYVNDITGEHHVALVKGDIGDGEDVLCRVHSECLTGDVFGSCRCDCGEQLAQAMRQIEKEGFRHEIVNVDEIYKEMRNYNLEEIAEEITSFGNLIYDVLEILEGEE